MTKETPLELLKRDGYNLFLGYDEIPYNIITHLMDNSQLLWKLLKYETPDSWERENLSKEEKAELIYAGEEDSSHYHVFMDVGQPDSFTKEVSILRVSNWHIAPKGRTVGIVTVSFQAYCHYKVNHLSNYKTRNDVMIGEILKTMNGVILKGGLGALYFDGKRELTDRMILTGQIPYSGKQLFMSMNYG